jgi:hypothetical protein
MRVITILQTTISRIMDRLLSPIQPEVTLIVREFAGRVGRLNGSSVTLYDDAGTNIGTDVGGLVGGEVTKVIPLCCGGYQNSTWRTVCRWRERRAMAHQPARHCGAQFSTRLIRLETRYGRPAGAFTPSRSQTERTP